MAILKLYSQKETAEILCYKHPRSLDRLIANGELECIKRGGLRAQKLFSEQHINNYLKLKSV